MSSGSLPLPHLGDWTHDGQPSALAGGDRLAGGGSQVLAAWYPRSAKPAPPGCAVVDEDGRQAGVGVMRGRDAADVPAVAGGEERAAARWRRARRRAAAPGRSAAGPGGCRRGGARQRPPHRAGAQGARRQVEGVLAEHLAGGDAPPQERHHLTRHLDVAEAERPRPRRDRRSVSRTRMLGQLAGEVV